MDNRIQLSTGFLTLPEGTDFPISLSFKDIRKGVGMGGFSQSVELDGSKENTDLLGLYFEIDLENSKFNRNTRTECTVVQNGVEVFTGYIQLMEIIRVNKFSNTNRNKVKYKISVFDEVANLFVSMGEKKLTDLTFPELGHVFNRANIIASWDNTSGYTYPIYAKDHAYYTLKDFKPAIFEKEYFDKIFATNGYTYTFDELTNSEIRLDKRIVPFNGKNDEQSLALQQQYTVRGQDDALNIIIDNLTDPNYFVGYLPMLQYLSPVSLDLHLDSLASPVSLDSIFEDAENQWDASNNVIENKAGTGRTWTILTEYDYSVDIKGVSGNSPSALDIAWGVEFETAGATRCDIILSIVAQSVQDPTKVVSLDSQVIESFSAGNTYNFAAGYELFANGTNASFADLGLFDANEEIILRPTIFADYYDINGNRIQNQPFYFSVIQDQDLFGATLFPPIPVQFKSGSSAVRVCFDIDLSNIQLKAYPDINELVKDTNVNIDNYIPKDIKQADIIASIQKSYNLIFSPDSDNYRNIIIKTRDKYYSDGEILDWSEKFEESQQNSIKFLSNEVSKDQDYTYSEDSDEMNKAYQDQFGEVYGEASVELDNEYTKGSDERELVYSPTPSMPSAISQVLPSINGINPDCNIRVLLNNGKKTISNYEFYDDTTATGTPLIINEVLKTSMFDNDERPNFSICFDSPLFLFHPSQVSQTSNYLYNLHHKNEVTTLNEGKRLTAYFNLTESDFQKLSRRLDWRVFIKDNGWFYISKVDKYNATKRTLTKVELITADKNTATKVLRPNGTIGFLDGDTLNNFNKSVNSDTNIIYGKNADIVGRYNFVTADNVSIIGDKNKVYADKTAIVGDNNNVPKQAANAKVFGNDTTADGVGFYVDGKLATTAYQDYSLTQTGATPTTLTKLDFNGATLVNSNAELFDTVNSQILKMRDGTVGEAIVSIDLDTSSGLNPSLLFQLRAYDIDGALLFSKRNVNIPITRQVSNYEATAILPFYFGENQGIEFFEIWWSADSERNYVDPTITVIRL